MSRSWDEIEANRGDPSTSSEYAEEALRLTLGRFARRLREQAGLTQAALAERMGTTQSSIARLERGGVIPAVDTLERMAEALRAQLLVGVVSKDQLESVALRELRQRGDVVVAPPGLNAAMARDTSDVPIPSVSNAPSVTSDLHDRISRAVKKVLDEHSSRTAAIIDGRPEDISRSVTRERAALDTNVLTEEIVAGVLEAVPPAQ